MCTITCTFGKPDAETTACSADRVSFAADDKQVVTSINDNTILKRLTVVKVRRDGICPSGTCEQEAL